jgi:hypothetical protein
MAFSCAQSADGCGLDCAQANTADVNTVSQAKNNLPIDGPPVDESKRLSEPDPDHIT